MPAGFPHLWNYAASFSLGRSEASEACAIRSQQECCHTPAIRDKCNIGEFLRFSATTCRATVTHRPAAKPAKTLTCRSVAVVGGWEVSGEGRAVGFLLAILQSAVTHHLRARVEG